MADIYKKRDVRKFGRVRLTDPYLYFTNFDDKGKPCKVLQYYMPSELRAAIEEAERTDDFSLLDGKVTLEPITDATRDLDEHELNWKKAERILSCAMMEIRGLK